MRSWFQRFMSGRYGFDQLGGFLCIVSFILVIVGAWVSPVLLLAGADFADLQLFPGAQPQSFQTICGKFKISHPAKQSRGLGQPAHFAL